MLQEQELPIPATGAVAPSCASEVNEPEKKRTLLELVATLGEMDEALADPEFDPETFIQGLRDKVDNTHMIIGRMETVAGWLKAVATPLRKKASTMLNNKKRLEAYVAKCLLVERDCRAELGESTASISIPGNIFKVRLRINPPSLEIDRDKVKIRAQEVYKATAEDFEKFPAFVTVQRRYLWDTQAIKMTLMALTKAGKPLPEGLPARLTRGFKGEFVPNIPEVLEAKKKGKKK